MKKETEKNELVARPRVCHAMINPTILFELESQRSVQALPFLTQSEFGSAYPVGKLASGFGLTWKREKVIGLVVDKHFNRK